MKVLNYLVNHYDVVLDALGTHLWYCLVAMFFSTLIALPLGVLISKKRKLSGPVNAVVNVIYAIPTLAMLAFFVPLTGLGGTTAVISLVLYNQYILIKSTSMAFDEIAPEVLEAGRAMGYTQARLFLEVELPLAMPTIVNGLKLAFMGTVSGATLAATVGAGGLGEMILMGQNMHHWHKVIIATALAALLGFLVSGIFQAIEDRCRKVAQGYGRGDV